MASVQPEILAVPPETPVQPSHLRRRGRAVHGYQRKVNEAVSKATDGSNLAGPAEELRAEVAEGCTPNSVTLNVYDVLGFGAVEQANRILRQVGTGIFHVGVSVHGFEWTFGGSIDDGRAAGKEGLEANGEAPEAGPKEGTGVFACTPRCCTPHHFRESVSLGTTALSEKDVLAVLDALSEEWVSCDYHTLHRNCGHFAQALCSRLGVDPLPGWVTNLAGTAAMLQEQTGVAWAAAWSQELDETYQLRSRVGNVLELAGHALAELAGGMRDYEGFTWSLDFYEES